MKKSKSGRKKKLTLSELEQSKASVLTSLGSVQSHRSYNRAIEEFIDWYCSEPRLTLNRKVVLQYRIHLESLALAPATINLHLAAIRRLAYEATDHGLLSPELVAGIQRVKGVKSYGHRVGNWLTLEQGQQLLNVVNPESLRGKRDAAMLGLLLGCGLRRSELAALEHDHIQQRENHWAIVDLVGKAGHIRTVPIPEWVMKAVHDWISAAEIKSGKIFRSIRKNGAVWGERITENVIWYTVKDCARRSGINNLAPHDLRRTCARLCHSAGGELEQIQFLLGHSSVLTTERYVGCKQKLSRAVNDRFEFLLNKDG
jgi:site-specific recombinase XerD